jgi:hypothetical protein
VKRALELGCKTPIILVAEDGLQGDKMEAMETCIIDCLAKEEISAIRLDRSICFAIMQRQSEEVLWRNWSAID